MASQFDLPDHWESFEERLFIDMTGGNYVMSSDENLQMLYDSAFFGDLGGADRQTVYEMLVDYLHDEYDLDLDDVFDWEAYREWYG